MAKKKGKPNGIKPWYSQYNQLQLPDLISGLIPKRIRNIQAAQVRLDKHTGRSGFAVNFERHHIVKNLAEIDDALARIENALRDGDDLKRWKDYPGLAGAVQQVNNVTNSLDPQAKQTPSGPFRFNSSRFFNDASLGNTHYTRPDRFATSANREPLRKQTKNDFKFKDEDELEEGEIVIKNEDEDEPGVPVGVGRPDRLPFPEAEEINYNPHGEPHQFRHRYETGFGGYSSGPPAHWIPQSHFHQPSYSPNYWHGVPNQYWHTPHPVVYSQAVMPHYHNGFVGFAPAGMIEQAYPQLPYASKDPYPPFRDVQQHFGHTLPVPPEDIPGAFLTAPLPPPPSVAPESPLQPPEPSPTSSLEKAPPSSPLVTQPLEDERARKRKLSGSPGSSSRNSRPLKRPFSAQAGTLSDANDNHHGQTKFLRATTGPPDFGTWFQEQIADSKKKLSQLERALKPIVTRDDAEP